MKAVDLAYMAGIFDGEGCIIIQKRGRYYNLNVSLGMANEYIPNLFKFSFGGSIFRGIRPYPCQVQWKWSIAAIKARVFLETILPYLKLKRNEAELAIEFQGGLCSFGGILTDGQLAVREAQKILMSKMKVKQ